MHDFSLMQSVDKPLQHSHRYRMKILALPTDNHSTEFDVFLDSLSEKLASAICKKLHAYAEANQINNSNSLKILKPKIWGYKGTIYKLRVDCGKESVRVLFTNTQNNDLALLHGFIKKTRKTPKKDARIAIENLERTKHHVNLVQMPLEPYFV